jgi:hypothetical protein
MACNKNPVGVRCQRTHGENAVQCERQAASGSNRNQRKNDEKGSSQTKEQGSSVGGPLASADLLYSFQHPVVGSDIGGRHLAERNESLCVEDPSLTN